MPCPDKNPRKNFIECLSRKYTANGKLYLLFPLLGGFLLITASEDLTKAYQTSDGEIELGNFVTSKILSQFHQPSFTLPPCAVTCWLFLLHLQTFPQTPQGSKPKYDENKFGPKRPLWSVCRVICKEIVHMCQAMADRHTGKFHIVCVWFVVAYGSCGARV